LASNPDGNRMAGVFRGLVMSVGASADRVAWTD
jgi:hypothetical protein